MNCSICNDYIEGATEEGAICTECEADFNVMEMDMDY